MSIDVVEVVIWRESSVSGGSGAVQMFLRWQQRKRSEERFSRNAETDLVCRLLLEKKKFTDFKGYRKKRMKHMRIHAKEGNMNTGTPAVRLAVEQGISLVETM